MKNLLESLRQYDGAYYRAKSPKEMDMVSTFIRNLGYDCVDNQTKPTGTYWEYIVINFDFRKGDVRDGAFYLNGTSPGLGIYNYFSTRHNYFWDRNRFLDYCILGAPRITLSHDRYYQVLNDYGSSDMVVAPGKKDIPVNRIVRMSTAAEINLKYIREGNFTFPNEYYDILHNKIVANNFYGY